MSPFASHSAPLHQTAASQPIDRRASRRVRPPGPVSALVRSDVDADGGVRAQLVDLSARGFGVRASRPLRPGERCELAVAWNGRLLRLAAEVRRCAAVDLVQRPDGECEVVYAAGLGVAGERSAAALEDLQVEMVLAAATEPAEETRRIRVRRLDRDAQRLSLVL